MIIEDIEKQQTSQAESQILNFLDYTVLMLSQASTVDEIDLLMDDFLSDDIMEIMQENKELFSVLSVVWLDTFERVCMRDEENNFSLKTLWLPVMFKNLGWHIEDQERLKSLHETARRNANESKDLFPFLVQLFVDGIYQNSDVALANFEEQVRKIADSEEDNANLDQLICDIMSLGWGH